MSSVHVGKVMVAAALAVLAGCGTEDASGGHDAGTSAGSGGTGGGGGDAGKDANDGCDGVCVSGPAASWDYPSLLWIGNEKDAPSCPAGAPKINYTGHADLDAPLNCDTCTCAAPTGSCSLPATMTANAAMCGGGGATTPFDPAGGWTGACDTNVAIASGKLCGGVKCVQSLTVGPLKVMEGGCTPSQPPAQASPTWKTYALGCQRFPYMPCQNGQSLCVATPPPGFRVCIFHVGDNECTGPVLAPYTEKHLFYEKFQDTRACSACACGAASGSTCSSTASIYTDGACSTLAYSATVDATGPACHDLPPGTPLGSKSATPPAYTPGTCAPSGGVGTGAATGINPSTYCCLPAP
jgi:hypothetical protein